MVHSRAPWAAVGTALTLSFNEFRVFVSGGSGLMLAVCAGGGRRPDSDEAQAPQQGTRSDHAATSLATTLRTRPTGTNFHRVLARPVCGALRCARAPTELSLHRQGAQKQRLGGKKLYSRVARTILGIYLYVNSTLQKLLMI